MIVLIIKVLPISTPLKILEKLNQNINLRSKRKYLSPAKIYMKINLHLYLNLIKQIPLFLLKDLISINLNFSTHALKRLLTLQCFTTLSLVWEVVRHQKSLVIFQKHGIIMLSLSHNPLKKNM